MLDRPILPHTTLAGAGEGRLLECSRALSLSTLVSRLKELLEVRHLRLALGACVDEQNLSKAMEGCFTKSIGIQVGEGAKVLAGCGANVVVTSEMAHAHVLAANAQGVVVILVGQSTIERAYLRHLQRELTDELADSDWNVKVKCSQVDSNALSIV